MPAQLATATLQVSAAIVGNVVAQELIPRQGDHSAGAFCELGGFVKLGTATTIDVSVADANGKIVYAATGIVANTNITPNVIGILGPLYVTITNISNAAHTATIYWNIKK